MVKWKKARKKDFASLQLTVLYDVCGRSVQA